MAATNTSDRIWEKLLKKLRQDYPSFSFKADTSNHWSPETKQVFYKKNQPQPIRMWSLLHELAHALLTHTSYNSDFELIKLEVKAWEEAKSLGLAYDVVIDEEHVQDCLDTYRDWLHKRSTCPTCELRSAQKNEHTYECFNCGTSWQVSSARFARAYRRTATLKK